MHIENGWYNMGLILVRIIWACICAYDEAKLQAIHYINAPIPWVIMCVSVFFFFVLDTIYVWKLGTNTRN